jgi:AcrR family transcriptional regulator
LRREARLWNAATPARDESNVGLLTLLYFDISVEITMPKIVDADAQRMMIRRAARRVFARRGVRGAGLIHVARLAGVGRATLYHYYADKAALVRDLVRELLSAEERLVAAALHSRQGTPMQRIERLAGELAELFGQWASLGRMLFDLWSTTGAMFRPFFRKIRRDLAELITDGQREGGIDRSLDPRAAAAAVIGLIDGMLLQAMVDNTALDDPAATRRLVVTAVRKILMP